MIMEIDPAWNSMLLTQDAATPSTNAVLRQTLKLPQALVLTSSQFFSPMAQFTNSHSTKNSTDP